MLEKYPRVFAATLVMLAFAPTEQAHSQTYPNRVVRLINPFPPGGAVDVMARLLAQKMSESLGQQVIVESRGGAGGNLGAEYVAKAPADGYTLLFTAPGPLVVNQTLYGGLNFDPERDFTPIGLFVVAPNLLMAYPGLPAKDVPELIALAKRTPGAINFASAGVGSINHLAGELFKSMAGIDIAHVPYRGAGPALNDLIGGHVQLFFGASASNIAPGQIRVLGSSGSRRSSAMPDVPTIHEQGLTGFEASSWYGLVAPAGTPEPVVKVLINELAMALKSPDVLVRIRQLGGDPADQVSGAAFASFMQAERKRWADVVRVSGAKAQ